MISHGSDIAGSSASRAISPRAEEVVVKKLHPMRPQDVDDMIRVTHSAERLKRLRTLVKSWSTQQQEERALRKAFAWALLVLLYLEIAGIFVAFFLVGTNTIRVPEWAAAGFLVAALAQSTSIILVVVKYLFPDKSSDVLKLVESFLSDTKPPEARGKQ